MVSGTCHCGAVTIEIPSAPAELTSCNCSVCRRTGGLWCYFSPRDVRVTGSTATYRWGDKTLDLHHCATCGCTTHWTPINPSLDRMGVNARLLDPTVVAAARIRH